MNQIPRLMPRFYLGQLDLLVQLAEEASELSAAAAKMVRVIRGVNPTPVKYEEALAALLEEAADGKTFALEFQTGGSTCSAAIGKALPLD